MSISDISERTTPTNNILLPTFWQHQRVYSFCEKYIRNKTIVELGCGEGYGTNRLARFAKSIIGVDKDRKSIGKAQMLYCKPNSQFLNSNFQKENMSETFDIVIALQVIEHVEDPDVFLTRIKKVTKKNGTIIVSTPNKLKNIYLNPNHIKEFSKNDFITLISKHFRKFQMYGLFGDERFNRYEALRKKQVKILLNLNFFGFWQYLPQGLKLFIFNLATFVNRFILSKKIRVEEFSEDNFYVNKKLQGAMDFIVIAKS